MNAVATDQQIDIISPRMVWEPLRGSQVLAMSCPAHHILYEGTRGPGKTDVQLMRYRRLVGLGYGAFWRGVIFDLEYKNLDDLVQKSKRWFPQFDDGAKFLESKADYKWTWPTGEELLFRVVKNKKDYWAYHGHEYPFVGWNELTKHATRELYDMMMSLNRSSFRPEDYPAIDPQTKKKYFLPPIPLEVFATTNPYGPGHNWVKLEYIDAASPGKMVKREIEVFNPQTQTREITVKTRCRIFGSYKENIYLTPEYIMELESIKEENKRRAWLWGDWDITSGGALDDVWSDRVVLPRFKIPRGWRLDRGFDWGSTHPFYVGWFAEANGEEVVLEGGRVFCPKKGSLILFHEWYGTKTIGTNEGLKMSAKDIAKGILKRDNELYAKKWMSKMPSAGPADNQIRDVKEKDVDTIEKKMSDHGVMWTVSDKSPGSRKNGLQLLRERLEATTKDYAAEEPGFFVMDHCIGARSTLPVLPRDDDDPDDVDTNSEDHPYDVVRYRVLAGNNRAATKLTVNVST